MRRKSLFCDRCSAPLEDDGTCKMCPGTKKNGNVERENTTCQCGCGLAGDIKQAGVWKCWKSAGYTRMPEAKKADGTGNSYRERWYRERGLPYEPPRLSASGSLRPMANHAPRRQREPGEDED